MYRLLIPFLVTGARSNTCIRRLYHGQTVDFEFIECRHVMFKFVRAEQPVDGLPVLRYVGALGVVSAMSRSISDDTGFTSYGYRPIDNYQILFGDTTAGSHHDI
jgi:hypothetical protein